MTERGVLGTGMAWKRRESQGQNPRQMTEDNSYQEQPLQGETM